MTEEQQAQLLAQWLENPSSTPPEGLDPEVIEALASLQRHRKCIVHKKISYCHTIRLNT